MNSIFYFIIEQLDELEDIYDDDNAFHSHPESVKFGLKHKIYHQIQMVVPVDLNDGKLIEVTSLLSGDMTIVCTCFDMDWHEYLCMQQGHQITTFYL